MRIKVSIGLFFSISFLFAQDNLLWKGYYSYNEIVDVANGGDKVYAATENSVFFKDLMLGEINQINSITGFKPESITTLYHSTVYDKTLAGNTNGLLLIVNKNGSITQKVDIIEEVPVPPNRKGINHFYEHEGKMYIATDYGISVLDLQTSEFVVTYFIGPSGEEVEVLQTTVLNNEIYAVTRNNGIRKASLSNPFLFDFNQWQTFDAGNWSAIITFNNELIAQDANTTLYRNNGVSFTPILNTIQNALKLKTNNEQIILTTQNNIFVLDQNYSVIAQVTGIPNFDVVFSAAIVINNNLYIGTNKNGVFSTTLSNPSLFENISPNGPEKNYIFRIRKAPNKLWAVYGRYQLNYDPVFENNGISSYKSDTGWETIPYASLLDAKCFTGIAISPRNNNEVYFSSYNNGVLKLNPNGDFTLFNNTNTGSNGLEQIPANTTTNIFNMPIRTNSPEFDKEGNLWLTSAWVTKGLKVLRANGQWQSYDFDGILEQATVSRFGPIKIDKNGTKWLPTRNDGILAFNDKLNNKAIIIDDLSGLPSTIVQCIEIDNRNQLWIGTAQGLRILSSIDRFVSENELSTTSIIIQEGDLAQELFFQQTILDIKVDGANRKWVSIADGGVFLVSSNGQQTIYRFTKNNSPLPSDNVVDIEIDEVSGEVYFATDKGMVSFLGTATRANDDLANVYVYPNPVRPEFSGTVKIAGLSDRANVKITDIEGNLVFETTSAGGTIEWDTSAFGNYKVASGVYMVFVASQDGLDSTVKKVMIVR